MMMSRECNFAEKVLLNTFVDGERGRPLVVAEITTSWYGTFFFFSSFFPNFSFISSLYLNTLKKSM